MFWWSPLDGSSVGVGVWVSPQVNKFEQVSSDYHQSSVGGEVGTGTRSDVRGKFCLERNTTKCNCSILNAATIPHLLFPILSFTRNSIYFHHVMKHLCIEHAVQTKLAPCDM